MYLCVYHYDVIDGDGYDMDIVNVVIGAAACEDDNIIWCWWFYHYHYKNDDDMNVDEESMICYW